MILVDGWNWRSCLYSNFLLGFLVAIKPSPWFLLTFGLSGYPVDCHALTCLGESFLELLALIDQAICPSLASLIFVNEAVLRNRSIPIFPDMPLWSCFDNYLLISSTSAFHVYQILYLYLFRCLSDMLGIAKRYSRLLYFQLHLLCIHNFLTGGVSLLFLSICISLKRKLSSTNVWTRLWCWSVLCDRVQGLFHTSAVWGH